MVLRKFILLFALLFVVAYPAVSVSAKGKKVDYGVIKIMTDPGGLLLTIDGKTYGETKEQYQEFKLAPGVHNVVVRLPNGKLWIRDIELPAGRIKCVVVNYKPLPPVVKSPCPFGMNVSAPKSVNDGEIITYSADVNYGGSLGNLKYNWAINPATARILSGAGTNTITVDSTGLGGQRITVTLAVDDGSSDAACMQTVQASSAVNAEEKKPIEPLKFDECDSCKFDDQKARLDHFATELQGDPTKHGYIIVYGGRMSPIGQVDVLMKRTREYLTDERQIDASRFEVVNGGFREGDSVELWVVPSGSKPPRATPTVQAGEVKGAAPARRKRY
jgi:hypothetical protein